jgi:hypothetical protein
MSKQEVIRAWEKLAEVLDGVCMAGDVREYSIFGTSEIQEAMAVIEKKLGL